MGYKKVRYADDPILTAELTDQEFLSFRSRFERFGICHHDGTYYVVRCYAAQLAIASWLDDLNRYGYGTYHAHCLTSADATFDTAGCFVYPFLMENLHGWPASGLIYFLKQNTGGTVKHYVGNVFVNATETELEGEDWTTEKEFKIAWTDEEIEFYIDSVLKATHSTNIPTTTLCKGFEAGSPEFYIPKNEVWAKMRGFVKES